MSSRRLEDEKCYAEDVLKTSWKTRNVCWDVAARINILKNIRGIFIIEQVKTTTNKFKDILCYFN